MKYGCRELFLSHRDHGVCAALHFTLDWFTNALQAKVATAAHTGLDAMGFEQIDIGPMHTVRAFAVMQDVLHDRA